MSQSVIFEIGAVVFIAVIAAMFLYGMSVFREWQDRDDARADAADHVDAAASSHRAITPEKVPANIVQLDRALASGHTSRPSAA